MCPGSYPFAQPGAPFSGGRGYGHTVMTNTKMTHIPYKSSGPSLTDLIAGQIQVLFNNLISTTPHVKSGRVRGLAITGATRSPEQFYGYLKSEIEKFGKLVKAAGIKAAAGG